MKNPDVGKEDRVLICALFVHLCFIGELPVAFAVHSDQI